MANNSSKAVLAIVAGAALGAVVGILFAPDKGQQTRSKIKRNVGEGIDELKTKVDDLSNKFRSKISAMDIEAGFDELVANVDGKTSEVVEKLERKLQELKTAAANMKK
ncbi:MAG: YtxH domain-containing protein [Flavobacterium sp.]|nr:YtxH domain-containing protein [Flavobacterium sp.]